MTTPRNTPPTRKISAPPRAPATVNAVANNVIVCHRCGRIGTRGFVYSSGNGDGTADTYRCASWAACQTRQDANPLPDDDAVEGVTA